MNLPLAQTDADTASGAAVIFGLLFLIGGLAAIGITGWGRRHLLPLISMLMGGLIGATAVADAASNGLTVLTALSLFIAIVLIFGGIGALRDGVVLPDVSPPDDDSET